MPVSLAEHGQFYFEDKNCRVWGALFSCVSHGPFALQEDEVSEVCWLTPEEITARCDEFLRLAESASVVDEAQCQK